jgi:hypothetical protein
MRRNIAVAAVVTFIASLAFVATAAGGGLWKAPPFSSIGIQTIGGLDGTFDINPDLNNAILRVFVETGSTSPKCLATLNEAGPDPAPRVNELFCGVRTVTFDNTVHTGLYLTLNLAAEVPPNVAYWVNVYQEGAKFYGTPMPCTMTGC